MKKYEIIADQALVDNGITSSYELNQRPDLLGRAGVIRLSRQGRCK